MTRFERLTLILTILFTGAGVWGGGFGFWVLAIGNAVMFVVGANPRRAIVSAINETGVGNSWDNYKYRRGPARDQEVQ